MKAGFLLSLTEPSLLPEAARAPGAARALHRRVTPARERAHLEAVQLVARRPLAAACRTWDVLLIDHPRDALALQWAQLWDFYRGDSAGAARAPGARAARVGRGRPAVPARAGALCLRPRREPLPRRRPKKPAAARWRSTRASPWAVHARGARDGDAGPLRRRRRLAAPAPGASGPRATASPPTCGGTRRCSASRRWTSPACCASSTATCAAERCRSPCSASMRRRCCGACTCSATTSPSAARRCSPAGHCKARPRPATTPSTTCTRCCAMLGAGDVARAEAWLARCAERALAADDARRNNHPMAREVGLPLMRGLLALRARRGRRRRRPDLRRARAGAALRRQPCAARPHRPDPARGLRPRRPQGARPCTAQRTPLAKPVTPLTRHWMEALGDRTRYGPRNERREDKRSSA